MFRSTGSLAGKAIFTACEMRRARKQPWCAFDVTIAKRSNDVNIWYAFDGAKCVTPTESLLDVGRSWQAMAKAADRIVAVVPDDNIPF